MANIDCIDANCNISTVHSLQNILIIPFEESPVELRRLFSYFLYSAPNIESVHSPNLKSTFHSDIFQRMMDKRHFKYCKFCASNVSIEKELKKGGLSDDGLCLKCKRFVCKKRQTTKGQSPETDLSCFLRHIRNSIAHGKVYYLHTGTRVHIVFEDENTSKKLSARIVCIKADLEHWKSILSDSRYYIS